MAKKDTALSTTVNEETLAILSESYPMDEGGTRIILPRLGMYSQDKTEGKGKTMKVIAEAGVFYTEKEGEELDENGKKMWVKSEIGTDAEVIIIFQRKQLKFFDGEKYVSSPVFDNENEVIPLFRDRKEINKGTPKELKALKEYQGFTREGKPTSKLEETKVLYVLYKDELYQLNLRGTSMYAFRDYGKKVLMPSVITYLNSEAKENGATSWNQMTFFPKRKVTQAEAETIISKIGEIKVSIQLEKSQYATEKTNVEVIKGEEEFAKF